MTLQRQFGFWLLALAALVALVWLLNAILLPFIAGLVLAYFLDPVADALERLGLPRLHIRRCAASGGRHTPTWREVR